MSNTRTKGEATGPSAHSDAEPAVEASMSRDTINIPDNVLQDAIQGYAQADQDDLLWLLGYAGQELRSRERLCELLVSDWSTIYRVCTGTYQASISSFMEKVRDLRRRVVAQEGAGFVETLVTKKVWGVLDYALAGDLDGGKIVLISGPTRRGKSYAVREWCRRNNHGRSVYIDSPESGGIRALMYEIADRCRVNAGRKTVDLRDRLIKSFNRRRILIIDEVGRLLPARWRQGAKELEFIRRLHDVQRCAIALIATPVFPQEMQAGYFRDYLEQLLGRIAEPLYIPEKVYRAECKDFLSAYNKAPSEDLVALAHSIANSPGRLGVLFELIRQAAALAKRRGEPLEAKHLLTAHQRRRNLYTWPEESAA